MNPDPANPSEQPTEPQQPAPEAPQTPVTPAESAPVSETPQAFGAPESATPAANPFGGTPSASSEAAPASPFGGQPAAAPAGAPTPAAGPSKKKLIVLISAIVGGLLVLGAIALVVYLTFFSVTKADYAKAYDQVKAVQQTSGSGLALTSGDPDKLSTAFAEYKTENAKLADLKALKADKDLNEKYKAYDEKSKAYISYVEKFIPSFEKFTAATKTLSSTSLLKPASIQATITALEGASDITEPNLKAYVDSLLAAYKEILPQSKIYESATTPSEKLKASSAISASTKKLLAAATKLSTDMKASTADISIKDSFDALSKAVTEKYNKK